MSVASVAKRFWSKVAIGADDECWPFLGSCNEDGYGNFRFEGRILKAHRVAWFLTHNVWPTNHVLHRCDHPGCQNPQHHFEGTHLDNMRDCIAKGRFNPAAKFGPGKPKVKACTRLPLRPPLSSEDVAKIRSRRAAGESQAAIARTYGVHQSAVSLIVRHLTHA